MQTENHFKRQRRPTTCTRHTCNFPSNVTSKCPKRLEGSCPWPICAYVQLQYSVPVVKSRYMHGAQTSILYNVHMCTYKVQMSRTTFVRIRVICTSKTKSSGPDHGSVFTQFALRGYAPANHTYTIRHGHWGMTGYSGPRA